MSTVPIEGKENTMKIAAYNPSENVVADEWKGATPSDRFDVREAVQVKAKRRMIVSFPLLVYGVAALVFAVALVAG